jgi:DHA2 family multidrug resistance protein
MTALSITTAQRRIITTALVMAVLLQTLLSTIANVALPHIQSSLGATKDQAVWVITAYIVAVAVMTPVSAAIAARIGARRLLLFAVTGFTLTSMLCGMASSLTEMVTLRLIQGAMGAAIIPVAQATLLDIYPKERHGFATSIWSIGAMIGPIAGPTLGGWLTEHLSWRWVFYVNVPFGIAALAGLMLALPERRLPPPRRFDATGFLLLGAAVGLLQFILDRGQSENWFDSTQLCVEAVVAALCFYLFIVHTFTTRHPFLDPRLFVNANLVAGLLLAFCAGAVLLASMALLPTMLQTLLGFPVLTTGWVMAPRGVGNIIGTLIVGQLVRHLDIRIVILAGMVLLVWSLQIMAGFNLDTGIGAVVTSGLIQGIGLGLVFVPITLTAFLTLRPALRTEAASLLALSRNLGSSIGVSLMVTLLARYQQANHELLAGHIDPFVDLPPLWDWHTAAGAGLLEAEISRQALLIAYLNDFQLMTWLVLLTMPLVLLIRRSPHRLRREAVIGAEPE